MMDFDTNLKNTKEYFNEIYKHIISNLSKFPTGNENYKNILFFQTINLCKELIFLLENKQFLSVAIVLRSALESLLKLIDIKNNGCDGIYRLFVSDISEKEKILKSGLVKEFDCPKELEELKQHKENYKNKISSQEKDFKLTHQAKEHSESMFSAVLLYSKYAHSNLSMLQQLYTTEDRVTFCPKISDEYQEQYLKTVQRIIHELKEIYNSFN